MPIFSKVQCQLYIASNAIFSYNFGLLLIWKGLRCQKILKKAWDGSIASIISV